jgi:tRNA pseudouridine55 synthase
MPTTPSGLILLNKQPGITSFDSLRDIKRALGTGKAGHTGTLDKFAGGLLLVLTGRALKLSQWFTHCDKQYEGTICFGAETETLDPEGAVIANAPPPSREAVEQALTQFRGEIQQAPPAYSAIHIDGERASTLARKGEMPEMQKRLVTIYRLELRSWEPPFAQIFVHCSSGTYIRSLARDIALAAGSRAYLSALIRTRVAGFRLEEAVRMNNEQGTMNNGIQMSNEQGAMSNERQSHSPIPHSSFFTPHSIDKPIFDKLGLPCIDVSPENAQKIIHGKPLAQILGNSLLPQPGKDTALAVFSDNAFIAMIESANNTWKYGYVNANN